MPSKYGFETEEDRERRRREVENEKARQKAREEAARERAYWGELQQTSRQISGAVRDVLLDYATATYPYAKDDHKVTEVLDVIGHGYEDRPCWRLGSSPEHLLYSVCVSRNEY